MKLQFTIIAFFLSIIVFSQSGGQGETSNEIKMELPVLSPQSPTTADLGKYGEVQVNESTGTVSPSIPLFDYNTGKISLPISLNYSGNGVRVNQDPTWTGINWNINPGGVITRIVKDKPDEAMPNYRDFPSEEYLNSLEGAGNNLVTSSPWINKLLALNSSNVDNEVDIFNYNFLGYSGSFFLDLDYNVHLIKYDKEVVINFYRVENNQSYFLIQTSEGDSFFFGGSNASESSRTYTNIGAGSNTNIPFTQNAFYLYQISFLNGGYVNFEYQQYGSNGCDAKIGIQESASKGETYNQPCTIGQPRNLYKQVQNSISLKKITSSFSNQHIYFETTELNHCQGIIKLNTIYLRENNNNNVLKKIKLNYTTLAVETYYENKFFLNKVQFYDNANLLHNDYELSYNNLEAFPSKDSFAQDELGFFNGKTSNTTLLPLTDNIVLNNSCYNLADREAFLDYASIGSLTRITYPTGGYTNFEYELPYKGLKQLYSNHNLTNIYGAPNSGYTTTDSQPTISGEFIIYTLNYYPDQGEVPLVVTAAASMTATLNTSVIGSISHQSKVSLYAIKTSLSGSQQELLIGEYTFPNTESTTVSYSIPYTFNLEIGSYIFRLAIKRHNSAVNNTIIANAVLKLPDGFRDSYYPGLRIKKVITNDANLNEQITRYYYNDLEHLNIESYQFHPNYVYITRVHSAGIGSCPGEMTAGYYLDSYNLTTSSNNNIFKNDMDKFIYEFVTLSFGGDNFENGGKQLHYFTSSNAPINKYATYGLKCLNANVENNFYGNYNSFIDVGINESFQNSILNEELIFDTNFNPKKRTKNNYSIAVDFTVDNMKIYNFCSLNKNNLYLNYQTKSYKYRSVSTETTEYLNGNPITTIVNKFYSPDKVSLPSAIETSTSKGETKRINLFYPSDVAIIGNLSPTDITNLNILQNNKHNVSELVKTESLLGGHLLDSKQISFSNFQGNILPSIIKFKKEVNTTYEDRVEFLEYDFHGNPLLVSLKEGTKTRYFYNTKNQVTLKIENYDETVVIDDSVLPNSTPCYYQNQYPNGMVTQYNYDPITNNLISIVDPKCDTITYTYDSFNRLKEVKDKNGNKLSENEYHYKP